MQAGEASAPICQEFRSRWIYDRFLLGWLPRYLLVKIGLLNRKKAMDAWMQGEITLLCGERPQVVNMMAEWVVVNHMWPQRRVDVLAKLEKHRRKGAQIAIVSGAYQPIVDAFARRVGDVRAIGSRLAYEDGRLSESLCRSIRISRKRKTSALFVAMNLFWPPMGIPSRIYLCWR